MRLVVHDVFICITIYTYYNTCTYVADIQGGQRRELFSTVRSFIYIIRRHRPPPDSSTQRRRDYTSPENALKPHILSYSYTYIVKLVNLLFFRIRLRTPSPECQSIRRHGGAQYPPQGRSCPLGNHLRPAGILLVLPT